MMARRVGVAVAVAVILAPHLIWMLAVWIFCAR